ncbi:hypothetical protein JX266_013601 [Neoarthrinium moseri]|nr:hypothetical protein JX266_013601 [Neoarthrinium moseri]
MLYKTNKEYRIFLAYEYASPAEFKYVLKQNPAWKTIGNSDRVKEDRSCAENGNLGSSSKVDILGVVWGLGIVTKSSTMDYLSKAADQTGIIDWTNDNMGGDTWGNAPKTGTVYYRHKGTTEVRQISGKERSSSYWRLQ